MVYQTSNELPRQSGGYRPVPENNDYFGGYAPVQPPPPPPPPPQKCETAEKGGLLSGIGDTFKRLFSDISTEDLLLIGIGLLLLLDGNKDNDMLAILLLFLLLGD